MIKKVNLAEKASMISEYWSPGILTELNGQHVKMAKIKGDFVRHHHENEDELFLVLSGTLKMEFDDHVEVVREGEMITVPKGVPHKPIADEEVLILLFRT